MRARVIVRATADNPAVDIGTTRRVLEAMARDGAEYGMEEGLPYGAATEAVAVTPPGPTSYRVPSIERDLSAVRASTRSLSAHAQQVAATPAPSTSTTPVTPARAATHETQSNEAETESEGRGEADD